MMIGGYGTVSFLYLVLCIVYFLFFSFLFRSIYSVHFPELNLTMYMVD